MTVKALLDYLSTCHPDDIVVLASDEEGNRFSPLVAISLGMYPSEEAWTNSLMVRELTDEMREDGYSDEDVGDPEMNDINCVALWPTC